MASEKKFVLSPSDIPETLAKPFSLKKVRRKLRESNILNDSLRTLMVGN